MTHTLNVRATRWSGGWELEIDEHHHTQSRTLASAPATVRDHLDTDRGGDHSDWTINVIPDIDGLDEATAARKAVDDAATARNRAAAQLRAAARHLRAEGLSVSDSATILGVSRGRISQLV